MTDRPTYSHSDKLEIRQKLKKERLVVDGKKARSMWIPYTRFSADTKEDLVVQT